MNNTEEAIKIYKDVIQSSQSLKKLTAILNTWNQLGNCYIRQGKYDEALEAYLSANEFIITKKIEVDNDLLSKLYLNIGKLYIQRYIIY